MAKNVRSSISEMYQDNGTWYIYFIPGTSELTIYNYSYKVCISKALKMVGGLRFDSSTRCDFVVLEPINRGYNG